jgi:enoyl-CoA hydratase/carnithine racemase
MADYKTITVEKQDGVAILTLNRPEVMNAISDEMTAETAAAVAEIDKDDAVQVLIVTGAGKAFQAGADIKQLSEMTPLQLIRWNEGLVRNNAAMEKIRQPVIAAINGAAMGGGLELALSCTLRVASEKAMMGLPEVNLGIIPGAGGTQRLPRLIGKGRAAKMILTGSIIGAEEALQIGLVEEVAPPDELMQVTQKLAKKIMSKGPVAIQMAKYAIEVGMQCPLEEAVQYSQKNCAICFSTEDMKEGTGAFLEKRKPNFQGK